MRRSSSSKHRPTVKDVAQQAGVSFKTVARVANNETSVSAETRHTVLKAMKALGYVPNVAARQLRSNRSFLIALLARQPSDPHASRGPIYIASTQMGAIKRCSDVGYHLIVEQVMPESAVETAKRLGNLRIDGVIVLPPLSQDAAFISSLQDHNLKCVLIASDIVGGGAPVIGMNDHAGAYEMTNFLLKLGHRKIGFITAGKRFASVRRYAGFLEALNNAGIPRRKGFEVTGDFSFRSGEVCGRKLLQRPDRPTAIFASNDEMALGVVVAAARLGINVPKDLSVVGFDDAPSATTIWPQLTTVRQPLSAMSAKAVDLLINDALYNETVELNLDFSIIKRGSTARPPDAPSQS
jgi:LacI family transcriptional regulator